MAKYRIISGEGFKEANHHAWREGFNRAYDPTDLERLLPDDVMLICTFSMIHEHKAGKPVAPHLRTLWMGPSAVPDSDELATWIIDMEIDAFEALDTHDTNEVEHA